MTNVKGREQDQFKSPTGVHEFNRTLKIPTHQIRLNIEVNHNKNCQEEVGGLAPLEEPHQVVLVAVYVFGAVVIDKGPLLGAPVGLIEEGEVDEEDHE
jgi:hypothetical protein